MQDDFKGKLKIVAVDVDNSGAVAEKYEVSAMPTLVVMKDGKEHGRVVGASEAKIRSMVEGAL